MPKTNDAIVTFSINVKTPAALKMAEKILDVIRNMPEYATDDGEIEKDTRRGGWTLRYEPFVFHPKD